MFFAKYDILINWSVMNMRMRKKPNLVPRMEKCAAVQIKDPKSLKDGWRNEFPESKSLWLELGCGKGRFTLGTAQENPEVMLIALEKVADAMIIGMERVCAADVKNVRFIDIDALELREIFDKGEIDRLFINFCDPWPKSRDAKHRLTAPGFLRSYADLLENGGEIHFKTDNRPLFDWSVEQFIAEGWELREVTNNLHSNGICGVMTDYEAKFHEMGVPINRLVAVRCEKTKDGSSGEVPRLRDAALSDARGALEEKEDKEK